MGANGIDSVTSNKEVDTQGWQRVLIKALQKFKRRIKLRPCSLTFPKVTKRRMNHLSTERFRVVPALKGHFLCGCNSMVECLPSKQNVDGSSPFTRFLLLHIMVVIS